MVSDSASGLYLVPDDEIQKLRNSSTKNSQALSLLLRTRTMLLNDECNPVVQKDWIAFIQESLPQLKVEEFNDILDVLQAIAKDPHWSSLEGVLGLHIVYI